MRKSGDARMALRTGKIDGRRRHGQNALGSTVPDTRSMRQFDLQRSFGMAQESKPLMQTARLQARRGHPFAILPHTVRWSS
jgi:hypothetical protein